MAQEFWETEETISGRQALSLLGMVNSKPWRGHPPETVLITKAVVVIVTAGDPGPFAYGGNTTTHPAFHVTLAKKKQGTWNQVETKNGLERFDIFQASDFGDYFTG